MATKNLGVVTAYGFALAGGYTGTLAEFKADLAMGANASYIAPKFSTDSSYTAGSYVFHNNVLYCFTSDHSAGAWSGTDAEQVTVGDELADLNAQISGGGSGSGLTEDIKQALLQIASKVAYIDADGQDYYDDLYDALYPSVDLDHITAVYTQSGTVYTTDSLDDLKTDLVVTASYTDSSSEVVTSYTLSGSLTVGTSTITVTYGGKTTTFTVTVTDFPYVTDGLVAYWDGIDNTGGSGHDGTVSKWTDLVNGYELTFRETTHTTWGTDAVVLDGNNGEGLYCDNFWTTSENATIEVVLVSTSTSTQVVASFDRDTTPISGSYYDARRCIMYNDGTVGFVGKSGNTYDDGVTAITDIRKMVAKYTGFTVNNAYVNGSEVSLSTKTHSFQFVGDAQIRVGVEKLTNSSNYPVTGKIHAIRVYSKHLSAEELAKNLSYDNTRFSLGLTL